MEPVMNSLFALAAVAVALPAVAAESQYSPLGSAVCHLDKAASRKITRHEDFDPMLYRCGTANGRVVSVTYLGLQVRVLLARKTGKSLELSTYYDAGPRIEWRGPKGAPTAAILRLTSRGDDGKPSSVLAVVKLTPEQDCLIGIIDVKTNPQANDLAQQAADAIGSRSCGKPELLGVSGTVGKEIFDLNVNG
jgi:hypothetical protein